jgi:hypothetical protein
MRAIINKPIATQEILEITREIFSRGWHTLKLYFMIGHPSETLEDVKAITELCKQIHAQGRQIVGKRVKLHVSVSTFIPKPHTPFQWVICDSLEQIERKQALLKQELRSKNMQLSWTDPHETMLEAWLSRGDRRLGQVIYNAWRNGAKFDAWQEHFSLEHWQAAFRKADLDPAFYSHRARSMDETLPWDHIDIGIDKQFLAEDYQWSLQGRTRDDCRHHCYACGILTTYSQQRDENPNDAWGCPQSKASAKRQVRNQEMATP